MGNDTRDCAHGVNSVQVTERHLDGFLAKRKRDTATVEKF